MNTLTFNNTTLNPINHKDGQIWLTSAELAMALGYKQSRAVTKIYNNNSDEFTESMTQIIEVPNLGTSSKIKGLTAKIRIFSLRGCHLLAMFARTKVAKEFRKWVLDILDKEVGEPVVTTTTKSERTPLKNAVNMLIGKTNLTYSEAYRMVHQYIGVNHIDEIAKEDLPKAVEYVHSLILKVEPKAIDNDGFSHLEYIKTAKSEIIDYVWKLRSEIDRLGGVIPDYPAFDTDEICKAFFVSMLRSHKMMLTIDYNDNPNVTFVPNDHWIITDENIATIVGDPSGISKSRLPDIMNAVMKRAGM